MRKRKAKIGPSTPAKLNRAVQAWERAINGHMYTCTFIRGYTTDSASATVTEYDEAGNILEGPDTISFFPDLFDARYQLSDVDLVNDLCEQKYREDYEMIKAEREESRRRRDTENKLIFHAWQEKQRKEAGNGKTDSDL